MALSIGDKAALIKLLADALGYDAQGGDNRGTVLDADNHAADGGAFVFEVAIAMIIRECR